MFYHVLWFICTPCFLFQLWLVSFYNQQKSTIFILLPNRCSHLKYVCITIYYGSYTQHCFLSQLWLVSFYNKQKGTILIVIPYRCRISASVLSVLILLLCRCKIRAQAPSLLRVVIILKSVRRHHQVHSRFQCLNRKT